MIGHHHPGNQLKGMPSACSFHSLAPQVDILHQDWHPVECHVGREIDTSRIGISSDVSQGILSPKCRNRSGFDLLAFACRAPSTRSTRSSPALGARHHLASACSNPVPVSTSSRYHILQPLRPDCRNRSGFDLLPCLPGRVAWQHISQVECNVRVGQVACNLTF